MEELAEETIRNVEESMETMEFSVALSTIWQFISRTNKYIDETQPWVLAKDQDKKERLGIVMAHLAESLRKTAVMLQPFLTKTPSKIFDQLGIDMEKYKSWDTLSQPGIIPEGTKVQKQDPIFPRLEADKEIQLIKEMMKKPEPKKEEEPKEATNEITFDEFLKLDLRVAEILHVEKMKNADKLLRIQLDLGSEKRQVVSGIAQHYSPEELNGRKVICVKNLKPVKLRGELSQGMILSGEDEDGTLSLATVEQSLPNGSKVK